MASPTVYRGGRKDVHFFIDFNRFKDFEELCHKEGKTVTQDLNDYIVQKKERNSIGEDVGENISCLGYSPRPVQQKIDKIIDTDEDRFNLKNYPSDYDWRIHFSKINNVRKDGPQIGEIIRYCRNVTKAAQYRLEECRRQSYLSKGNVKVKRV